MMKKVPAQLKREAKVALKGNYAFCTGCLAVMGLALFFFCICANMTLTAVLAFMGLSQGCFGNIVSGGFVSTAIQGVGAVSVVYALFTMAVSILIMLFAIGYLKICYRICKGERGEIRDLFFPFGKNIGKFIGFALLFQIVPFLFGIMIGFLQAATFITGAPQVFLTVFSVIILIIEIAALFFLSLNYGMAALIFIEEPERPFFEALKESRRIMKGNRLRGIWLGLSFLGMFLLAYCSCGIGFLWVAPYMACTNIFFYFDITKASEVSRWENDSWVKTE